MFVSQLVKNLLIKRSIIPQVLHFCFQTRRIEITQNVHQRI